VVRSAKSYASEHLLERERDSWRMRRRDDNDRKTYDEVFNKENLMRIYKLFSDGVIDRFDFPISTGKEGNVFRASTENNKLFAVKIFRTSNASFKDMAKYIVGDPRFRGLTNNRRKLILAWAAKEFRNLQRLTDFGVRVPKPIAHNKNIIVMEYIGDETAPARELRNVQLENPEEVARKILDYTKISYQKAGLVHGDLSEFNVLMFKGEPVIIDVGQAVLLEHPMAKELLERDVKNIARYFRKLGVKLDVVQELKEITKK
jgi:RIO kinase 1